MNLTYCKFLVKFVIKYQSNHFLLFYSFRYFEYSNYLKNFKYFIISHCSVVLDILSNILITLKNENLGSNIVITWW